MSEILSRDHVYGTAAMLRLLLKKSPSWWAQHRQALYAKGFPRPITPIGRPHWAGVDLIAWRDRPKIDEADLQTPGVHNLRNLLAERGAAIATKPERRA